MLAQNIKPGDIVQATESSGQLSNGFSLQKGKTYAVKEISSEEGLILEEEPPTNVGWSPGFFSLVAKAGRHPWHRNHGYRPVSEITFVDIVTREGLWGFKKSTKENKQDSSGVVAPFYWDLNGDNGDIIFWRLSDVPENAASEAAAEASKFERTAEVSTSKTQEQAMLEITSSQEVEIAETFSVQCGTCRNELQAEQTKDNLIQVEPCPTCIEDASDEGWRDSRLQLKRRIEELLDLPASSS